MSKQRLLALSFLFPPVAKPEAFLIAKRLAHLREWDIDVIAATPHEPLLGYDGDLTGYAEAGMRSVTRVRPIPHLPWARLRLLSRIPDPLRYMTGKVVRAAMRLGPRKFDAMLSWSQFHSIHLAARRLKKACPELPWLAHFSDPWVDNPYNASTGFERKINHHLERRVVEAADRLLFTAEEAADLMMAKYPAALRRKVRVIPHGFDPNLYSGRAPPPLGGRRLVCRYIGDFYGPRTPEPLYRSLARALQRRPSLASEMVIELVGQSQFPDRSATLSMLPEGLVVRRPAVGYRESLAMMEASDLLIVIDAPAERSVFLPSKLIDYLGSGRPIVAFTPQGAAARVASAAGYPVADPGDVEKGAAALIAGLELARRNEPACAEGREPYTSVNTGAKLAALLDEFPAAARRRDPAQA